MALNFKKVQLAAWVLAAFLFFLHRFDRWDHVYNLAETLVSFGSYIIVVYGYHSFIYPRFYHKLSFSRFVLVNCFFLYTIGCLRIILESLVTITPDGSYDYLLWTRSQMAYVLTTLFIAFIIGVLLRVSINHLSAKKEMEDLRRKHFEMEEQLVNNLKPPYPVDMKKDGKDLDGSADFFIKSGTKILRLQFSAISHFEASGEYVVVNTKNEKLLAYKRMKELEIVLPSWFVRIHNSYIINTNSIDRIENHHVIIGSGRFSISEKYREGFYKIIEARTI